MSHKKRCCKLLLTQLGLALVLVLCLCVADSLAAPQAEAATATSSSFDPKVKLGVYMESLCPDSRRFFLDQLVPTHRQIGQALELKLVPFGHARVVGNNKMVCQHGSRECEGNRRMACLLVRSSNQTEIVETLGCLFRSEVTPKECCQQNMPSVNFDEVEKCKEGDESYQLMTKAEKDTGRLNYVPHLTVDNQASDEIQDRAERHLKEFMCEQYKGTTPLEPCKDVTASTSDTSHQ